MRVLLPVLTLGLFACNPPDPDVNIDFIDLSPLEVDIVHDCCGFAEVPGSSSLTCQEGGEYISEEVMLQITLEEDDWFIEEEQAEVDFYEYSIEYALLNENGSMPTYTNGMQLHVSDGQTIQGPIRGASFDQKTWARETFGESYTATGYSWTFWDTPDINARAFLTLKAIDSLGRDYTYEVNYDIIFADFDGCAR